MALVDVRRAYFYAPARRRAFVELPTEDYQAGDKHMCGLLQYSLYGATPHKIGRRRAAIDTQRSQSDEREHVPVCVARLHQGRTHCGNGACGRVERSVVEFFIKLISRKYEIKM